MYEKTDRVRWLNLEWFFVEEKLSKLLESTSQDVLLHSRLSTAMLSCYINLEVVVKQIPGTVAGTCFFFVQVAPCHINLKQTFDSRESPNPNFSLGGRQATRNIPDTTLCRSYPNCSRGGGGGF